VLHIINFAHGAALMVALYAVYLLKERMGIDPYLALPLVVPGMFVLGYALQRGGDQPRQPRQGREHPAGHAGHQPSCWRTWR
jgi:branched-subunit amino acid ABC-type transport system permease component